MFKTIMVLCLTYITIYAVEISIDDTDNDLVPNSIDRCPNTPEGVFVTQDGCTQQIKKTVYFKNGSIALDQKAKVTLLLVKEIIDGAKGYTLDVCGHTDSTADEQTNMILSQKRANAVKKFLLNSNIKEDIITIHGYGETEPIAPNTTSEGRSKNRRVDIILK